MTAQFTKAERKQVRELASTVHEAEAHALLESLDGAAASTSVRNCFLSFMSSINTSLASSGPPIRVYPTPWFWSVALASV
jgi:hypothetical protein